MKNAGNVKLLIFRKVHILHYENSSAALNAGEIHCMPTLTPTPKLTLTSPLSFRSYSLYTSSFHLLLYVTFF
jgi:hypothetical protein